MLRPATLRLLVRKEPYLSFTQFILRTFIHRAAITSNYTKFSPSQLQLSQNTYRAITTMSKLRPTSTVTGSCLCGSVQYTCTGTDRGAVLCHCRNCQKGSGSAFAYNYRFLKAKLSFSKGADMVKEYADKATKTGNTLYRHFCKECGTPIYLRNGSFEGLLVLHTGPMDSTPNGMPSVELFGENRKEWFQEVGKAKL